MITPKFIQITSAGPGRSYGTRLYGLTADGDVYQWQELYDDPTRPHVNETHREWVKLENPAT